MRTFAQLEAPERDAAVDYCLKEILLDILKGGRRFNDFLQDRIDAAWGEAEQMQTPWFAHEYIMEAVGDELRSMAQANAREAAYADSRDPPVIRVAALLPTEKA